MAAEKEKPNFKVVADNRRARYDYEIGETFEAGMMLTGTEVKSLRTGKATVAESYAAVDRSGGQRALSEPPPDGSASASCLPVSALVRFISPSPSIPSVCSPKLL